MATNELAYRIQNVPNNLLAYKHNHTSADKNQSCKCNNSKPIYTTCNYLVEVYKSLTINCFKNHVLKRQVQKTFS